MSRVPSLHLFTIILLKLPTIVKIYKTQSWVITSNYSTTYRVVRVLYLHMIFFVARPYLQKRYCCFVCLSLCHLTEKWKIIMNYIPMPNLQLFLCMPTFHHQTLAEVISPLLSMFINSVLICRHCISSIKLSKSGPQPLTPFILYQTNLLCNRLYEGLHVHSTTFDNLEIFIYQTKLVQKASYCEIIGFHT